MKRYPSHRFAAFVSFVAVVVGGCIAGSSRNVNVADAPGQTPVQQAPVNVVASPFDRGKESYRVYSVILNHHWDKGNLVVRDRTDRGLFQNDEWLDNNVGKTYADAVGDFKKANDKETQIENRFDYNGKISLIDQQEFKTTIGGGDGWDAFRKNHLGASGIVTFSAVGFDRDGNHALVNVSYLCANRCGNGSFYILEMKNGEWIISQDMGTWIS